MKKFSLILLAVLSANLWADEAKIREALEALHVSNISISDSPIAGLKTVVSDQGIFYAAENGEYFLQGTLVQVRGNRIVDLSHLPLLDKLKQVQKDAITFTAPNEKYTVSVWTDYTCPFCVKLHKEIKEYNRLGITVRYLAFPRAGGKSVVAKRMQSVWTAKDPGKAFDAAVDGKEPKPAEQSSTVAEQYSLGVQFGVSGTPAWVSDDGTVIVGYKKPADLLEILQMQAEITAKDKANSDEPKEQEEAKTPENKPEQAPTEPKSEADKQGSENKTAAQTEATTQDSGK